MGHPGGDLNSCAQVLEPILAAQSHGVGSNASRTCLGRVVPAVQQRARVEAMEALYCMPAQYGVVVHRIKMCPSVAIVIARSTGIMTMLVRTKRLRKR